MPTVDTTCNNVILHFFSVAIDNSEFELKEGQNLGISMDSTGDRFIVSAGSVLMYKTNILYQVIKIMKETKID